MDKKIGLFWLRDDFRFAKNKGLIEATINHDQVVVFYLYKKDIYKNQEAQKWWLSESLKNFKFEISLISPSSDSLKIFALRMSFFNSKFLLMCCIKPNSPNLDNGVRFGVLSSNKLMLQM